MVDDIAITLFLNELESRQIELLDECTTDKEERESFVRVCSEILCDSGMLIDEPEIDLPSDYEFTDEEWAVVLAAVGDSKSIRNVGAAMMYVLIKKDERFSGMEDA